MGGKFTNGFHTFKTQIYMHTLEISGMSGFANRIELKYSEGKKRSQLQNGTEQGSTKLDVSKHILASLLGTPINLSDDLLSSIGDIDRSSPALTL